MIEASINLDVKIYTPESTLLQSPKLMLSEMWFDLLASRELAWRLLVRDISARYRQSFLGIFWAFVPPIVMAFGLFAARKANVINISETNIPYIAYVMLSMILWQTFTQSLMSPIIALQQARPMLAKINFPREALILAKVGEILFDFLIKLIMVIGIFIYFQLGVSWSLCFVPFALFTLIAFGLFLGIMLAPISSLYTDVQQALSILTRIWLFLTPVIYPPPTTGVFSSIVNLNPVTHLLVTTRDLATGTAISNLSGFFISVVIAWLGLSIAWVFYRMAMPFIIERMSA
ncbi:ABC transporter permease [Gammaproteobacteria bacterium]|nr:ABC transporter permease [Gammaproteobacteria bacterium]